MADLVEDDVPEEDPREELPDDDVQMAIDKLNRHSLLVYDLLLPLHVIASSSREAGEVVAHKAWRDIYRLYNTW